jgi:XTP/dITP diphosphohydrolase
MTGRVVLLVTSPRLPAGLLTAQAWELLRAHRVYAAAEDDLVSAVRAAGGTVTIVEPAAQVLLDAVAGAGHGTIVWLAGPAGDEPLARELGLRLVRDPGAAHLEVVVGSWDPPGARLLDAVAVMDRLLAPDGGDPWKRSQTHRSLAPYLLEEAYEAYDAIEAGDLHAMREELGDVLLQVVLHAGMAAAAGPAAAGDGRDEAGDGRDEAGFDIDDVAGDLVDKLIRRNPHVFAGEVVDGIDDIVANWEQIKKSEKARASVLDGVALSQPALSLAAKVLGRVERAGLDIEPTVGAAALTGDETDALGAQLLALVADARSRGLDPEAALRRAVLAFAEEVRRAERPAG